MNIIEIQLLTPRGCKYSNLRTVRLVYFIMNTEETRVVEGSLTDKKGTLQSKVVVSLVSFGLIIELLLIPW